MVAADAAPARTARLDQLTPSRFLVVLLVLFVHGVGGIYRERLDVFPFSTLFHFAPSGVGFLFVLSGFVMSLVYHRPAAKFDVRSYWVARFVRLYPLYLLAFVLMSVYYAEFMPRISPAKIWANLFMIQGWIPAYAQSFNYPAWSITVEVAFYSLFPFLTIWSYRQPIRRLIWASIAFWVVSQIVHYFMWARYFPAAENFIVYNPLFYMNSCFLGAVGGAWYVREARTSSTPTRVTLPVLGIGTLLVVAVMVAGYLLPWFPNWLQPMQGLFAPFFLIVILALACDRSRVSSALSHPLPVYLGETAYALYILHIPVTWLYRQGLQTLGLAEPLAVWAATALPLMVLAASAAHTYVDQPVRRWLSQFMRGTSVRLLMFDLVAVALSVYVSLIMRFDTRRELTRYEATALLMFWFAVVVRTLASSVFRTNAGDVSRLAVRSVLQRVALAVTAGSVTTAVLLWAALALNWIPGVPRAVLLIDWALVMVLSIVSRLALRAGTRPVAAQVSPEASVPRGEG